MLHKTVNIRNVDVIGMMSIESMWLMQVSSQLLMMSKWSRIDLNHLQNHVVQILFITYIYSGMSIIVAQMLYYLSWIYGKYNFAWFNMFKSGMMINERIKRIFYSRLNLLYNGSSHIQWTLSLVVDVRRSDFYFSWNSQDCFLSCLTSTMSLFLMWVFCYFLNWSHE